MSRDLQNICLRTKKKKKTRVAILKFESKKTNIRVELKKKIVQSRKRER